MPEPLHSPPTALPDAATAPRAALGLAAAGVLVALLSAAAGAWLWSAAASRAAGMPTTVLMLALAAPLALGGAAAAWARRASRAASHARHLRTQRRHTLLKLLDLLPNAIALCDTRANRIAPNLAMAHLLQLDREGAQAVVFDWQHLLAPEDGAAWQAACDAALQTGLPQGLRCTMQLRGQPCAVLAQMAPFQGEDGVELAVTLALPHDAPGLAQATIVQLRELLALTESEKWRFGQAVHDELGQRLSGMAYFAKALQRKLQTARQAEAADAGWLTDLANESMAVARGLARGLLPVGSDDPGALGAALAELCERAGKTFSIVCSVEVDAGFDAGGAARASHLYHAVQELVTNAIKHGQAQQVRVRLAVLDDRQRASVHDNGSGLGGTPPRWGMGLNGVRSRAAWLGAQFSLADHGAGGVLARIDLPPVGSGAAAQAGEHTP